MFFIHFLPQFCFEGPQPIRTTRRKSTNSVHSFYDMLATLTTGNSIHQSSSMLAGLTAGQIILRYVGNRDNRCQNFVICWQASVHR